MFIILSRSVRTREYLNRHEIIIKFRVRMPPNIFGLAVKGLVEPFVLIPRWPFCFGSLVILDVECRFLSFFLLYIKIEIGKIHVKC